MIHYTFADRFKKGSPLAIKQMLFETGKIKRTIFIIFDYNACIITRKKIDGKNCLVITSGDDETIVITPFLKSFFGMQ